METRGIRNNNPFNIRYNHLNKWIGLTGKDKNGFCVFDTLEHGIRAGLILLRNYKRKGINTIEGVVNRFAPSSENDCSAYVDFLYDSLGFHHDLTCRYNWLLLAQSIMGYESKLHVDIERLVCICIKYNISFI